MTEHRRDPMNPFRCICGVEHSNNYAISRHIAKMCNGRDGGEVMEDEVDGLKAQLKRAITIAELLNVDEVCADTYWDMIKELQQMKGEIKE